MNELNTTEYAKLLGEIKARIRNAQYEALKAVNKELISLYWDIGETIIKRQIGSRAINQGFTTRVSWHQRIFSFQSMANERFLCGLC